MINALRGPNLNELYTVFDEEKALILIKGLKRLFIPFALINFFFQDVPTMTSFATHLPWVTTNRPSTKIFL